MQVTTLLNRLKTLKNQEQLELGSLVYQVENGIRKREINFV